MAGLPDDAAHLELSKTECNMILQDLWYSVDSKDRQSRSSITTVAASSEYVLNKYFDGFIKNTLQGPSSSPRPFTYLETESFYSKIMLQATASGLPQYYTFGEIVGYDAQLASASVVTVYSSEANTTSGSINFVSGSDLISSGSALFTINDVGKRVKKTGDSKAYKIGKFISTTQVQLIEKYRGASASAAAYTMGDIGVYVDVQGYVGSQLDSETIELNGTTHVNSTKTFSSIVSVSKSDKTTGRITCENLLATLTVATFAPHETSVERQTVVLWPTPSGAETLNYRMYIKHPWLWMDTDRILLREKWHRLISWRLEKRLRESFGIEVPKGLVLDIEKTTKLFEDESEDTSHTPLVPNEGGGGLGDQFYFDKFRGDYV